MSVIPLFPEFTDVDITHRCQIEACSTENPRTISELNFAEIFAWHNIREMKATKHNGNIILLVNKAGKKYIYPPFGNNAPYKSVIAMLEWLSKNDPEIYAYGFNEQQAKVSEESCVLSAEEDRDNADYVYSCGDLIRLAGRKFDGKRNHLKNFYRNFESVFEKITPEMIPAIKDFQERWCRERMCEDDLSLANESKAVMEVLDNYTGLPVFGGVLKIKGEIQAFTVASELNSETAVVLFEKARPELRGIYQAINQQFCENMLSGYKWINREQDSGDEGLRRAKLSYNPARLEMKYILRLRENKKCAEWNKSPAPDVKF